MNARALQRKQIRLSTIGGMIVIIFPCAGAFTHTPVDTPTYAMTWIRCNGACRIGICEETFDAGVQCFFLSR